MDRSLYPIANALDVWRRHMEIVHNATKESYGDNVLGWHRINHPECKSLPSFEETKKFK